MLCVKPLNGPIEILFFKTFGTPERDASGCGWHFVCKTMVRCGEAFECKSDLIRLCPVTSQTIDQQLDDVIAAIRGFTTQVLAKSDFLHLMALPEGMSRNELPDFTESSAQAPVHEVCPPLPSQFSKIRFLIPKVGW